MKEVIYVSGKITGDYETNQQLGIKKGAELMKQGYAPIIPHGNLKEVHKYGDFSYRDYMLVDFAHVRASDVVYMMSNWKDSAGARREERYARLLKKKIIYEEVNHERDNKKF